LALLSYISAGSKELNVLTLKVWQKGDIHVAATKLSGPVGTGQAGASARPAKDRFSEATGRYVCNELSANLKRRTS